jgi:hypothetical protein
MAGPSSLGTGGGSPRPSRSTLGLSCQCPPGMCIALVVCLRHSHFSCFCSNFKKWCHGDRSHASSIPIARRSTARPPIPPCLPLMASLIASVGDLAEVALGSQWTVVAPVPGVSSAGGASQGASVVEVVGPGPQLGDDTGRLLRDLVMCSASASVPGSATPGDAAPTPRSSCAMGPRVSRLYLSGSLGFTPPPINWRWVGDEAESMCSWVTTVERLLHETLVSVN